MIRDLLEERPQALQILHQFAMLSLAYFGFIALIMCFYKHNMPIKEFYCGRF